jgi:dCTP deaminase
MIINGLDLLEAAPIKYMINEKRHKHGVSWGLSEAGYDIRLKQDIEFAAGGFWIDGMWMGDGNFTIASAIEEFHMPSDLVGIVHDKSSWARHGLSVYNTVIEPSWRGHLTLELVYHGRGKLHIPAGAGIAQVIFHQTSCNAYYDGKYQNQADMPVSAKMEE